MNLTALDTAGGRCPTGSGAGDTTEDAGKRIVAVVGAANSRERANRVVDQRYRQMLGRPVDAQGLAVSVGPAAFDEIIDSGEVVKWVVLEDGGLVVQPKTIGSQEISHTVLSGGAAVRAASEGHVAGSRDLGYFGLDINNHSGHFRPSGESLQIGRAAFEVAGKVFR